MMFMNVAAGNPEDILNWGFVWRYELATITLFIVTALLARSAFSLTRLESGIFGLNAAYPNYGYMGVPLAIMAFGDAAAMPLALMLFADTVILLMLTAAFVVGGAGGLVTAMRRTMLTLVKNPLLISVVAGLAFAASGLALSGPIDTIITMLAGAAAPVALFALGATVYGQPLAKAVPEIASISAVRLFLHPAMVAGLFLLLPGQDIIWVQTAILAASLPVAANVFVLASHYGGYAGRTASAILASTILASISVPVVLFFLFRLAEGG
jgi:predicted permease